MANTQPAVKPPPSFSNPDPRALGIIGYSISAPGGEDVDHGLDRVEYYEFLTRRGSGTIRVPSDRWNAEAYHGTGPGKICTTKGGFIPDICMNDLQEFGITPAEASQIATSQAAVLHQAFNALQHSGVDFRGSTTGVYIGCANLGSACELDITECREYYMTGSSLSIVANRVSFIFDLMGPSLPVDTACSSALTAMHLASQAVRNGECDQAVVAGVNLIISPLETSSFSQLGVLSPDGISKSFDASANGYARGDVISAVVIKRHDLAIADHNHIYASLVGTSLTSCGSLMGSITTPSAQAQTMAIRNAYADAGLHPSQADFVELHGTGTTVGDSIEANTAGAVFSQGRDGREIIIGSVKSNIGHGEMGAYMSSLVKIVMMLSKGVVLPNGFFEKPSPKIEFEKYNLRVPVEVEDFSPRDPSAGLIASISSFGFGGSCGHTVLRSHEARPALIDYENGKAREPPFLFVVGGLSPRATNTLLSRYREEYGDEASEVLSEHIGSRARQTSFRTFAIGESISQVTFPDPVVVPKRPPPLIFCFSGQGPQHWAMGRQLYVRFAAFRESIDACDAVHKEYTGYSFIEETGLFKENPPSGTPLEKSMRWPADIISIGITFFQVALFDLMSFLGIKPDAILGHSIGETAVFYASGAMPRDMVVKISIARGRALKLVDSIGGAMAAVSGADAKTVQDHIDATTDLSVNASQPGDSLYIAAYNTNTDVGVSGPEYLVNDLTKFIDRWTEGVKATKLRVSTAVHSPYVEPCREVYRSELEKIFAQYPGPHVPKLATMSTVTANYVQDSYTIDYLWNNLRQPVRFAPAVSSLMEEYGETTTFVEIAPHPVLTGYLRQLGASEVVAGSKRPPSARHLKPGAKPPTEVHTLLESLGQLVLSGINSLNFACLNGCPPHQIEGPAYPFQKKYRSFAPMVPTHAYKLLPPTRLLNSERLRVSALLPEPWMGDHVIDQSNLVPAAAYMEMMLEFPGVTSLFDCRFENACIMDPALPAVTLEVKKDGNFATIKSSSGLETMQGDLTWTRANTEFDVLHAYGKLGYGLPEVSSSVSYVEVEEVISRCTYDYSREDIYEEMGTYAQFGPEFMRINRVVSNEHESLSWIRGSVGVNESDYHVHPAILDACLQVVLAFGIQHDKVLVGGARRDILLPHSVRHIYRNDGSTTALNFPEEFLVYAKLHEWTPNSWLYDAYMLADGHVVFTLEGLRFQKVEQGAPWPQTRLAMEWQPYNIPNDHEISSSQVSGVSKNSEEFTLLKYLDYIASTYIHKFVASLPEDFSVESLDRQRYLDWCRFQAAKAPILDIPADAIIQEKYAPLIEISERVARSQRDLCLKSTSALDLVFFDDIMSKVHDCPPYRGVMFEKVGQEFVQLIRKVAASGKKVIRVLEVGAGTGHLTNILGEAMVSAALENVYVDYVCTDASISLAQEAASRTPWHTVTPLAFDLDNSAESEGIDPASFDIVVGFDVLRRSSTIPGTLDTLRGLLVPGGYLEIIELDGRTFSGDMAGTTWMNWVFGTLQEWFGVLDNREAATHCTLSCDSLDRTLKGEGFATAFITAKNEVDIVDHLLFVSQLQIVSSDHGSSSISASGDSDTGLKTPNEDIQLETHHIASDKSKLEGSIEVVERIPLLAQTRTPSPTVLAPEVLGSQVQPVSEASTFIRFFEAGSEVALASFFAGLDGSLAHTIWLHTPDTIENTTLIGIVRTLRLEFSLFKIYLVLFPSTWSPLRQYHYINNHLGSMKFDSEIRIDEDGTIHVPRIVDVSPPKRTEAAGTKAVEFELRSGLLQAWRNFPRSIGETDVEVQISFMNVSPAFPSFAEFSGRILNIGKAVDASKFTVNQRVFGIAPSSKSTVVVCDVTNIAPIPSGWSMLSSAALAGRSIFGTVARTIANPLPTSETQALLHAGNGSAGALSIFRTLVDQSFKVITTLDSPSEINRALFSDKKYPSSAPIDVENVATWSLSTRDEAPSGIPYAFVFNPTKNLLRETVSLLNSRGTIVCFGTEDVAPPVNLRFSQRFISISYEHLIAEFPIESCLSSLSPKLMKSLTPRTLVVGLHDSEPVEEPTSADRCILVDCETMDHDARVVKGGMLPGTMAFDPRKAYVVIGGVGGLGLAIAQLLVELGARHIVLTSRSGEKRFNNGELIKEKRTVKWLRSLPGVRLDVVAVDCLDAEKTKNLFQSLPEIGGVFYLAVLLKDALFTSMTNKEDWTSVYDVKVRGFQILLESVDPKKLEFLVVASSMAAVVGSPGQANYAGAQTWMEAIAAIVPRTTTVAVPPLTDGGIFVRSMPKGARSAALDKYKSLGMTCYQMAHCCVDAIQRIDDGDALPVYIPNLNWRKILEMGLPSYTHSLVRHLLVKDTKGAVDKTSTEKTIKNACAMVLSMELDDVEDNVPLSSYGLDSLTSVRLSGVLKAHFDIAVTQLQLLGGSMTVARLEIMREKQALATAAANSALAGDSSDSSANAADEALQSIDLSDTIVHLNGITEGRPLFIIHGAGGGILVLQKIASKLPFPVYGVQDTVEAPVSGTLGKLAEFYTDKIMEKMRQLNEANGEEKSKGYRIAGFSFGTAVSLFVSLFLKARGETVESLIFLDGSPAMFEREAFRNYILSQVEIGTMKNDILDVVKDMAHSNILDNADDLYDQFIAHFEGGGSGPSWIRRFCSAYNAHLLMGVRASLEVKRSGMVFAGSRKDSSESLEEGQVLIEWPANRTVLVKATRGLRLDSWAQGVSNVFDLQRQIGDEDKVEVYDVEGSHFGILNPASGLVEVLREVLV
ncbi:hypothetical protein ABKN59_004677 [Abortiporus biennis]